MPPFSTTAINKNLKVAVVVAGFCINQLPAFPLPALRFILGNILNIAVILFYFFLNSIFSYKTQFMECYLFREEKNRICQTAKEDSLA